MISSKLENLLKTGKLKADQVSQAEFDGMVLSGDRRLADAKHDSLSMASRFDLAYNASHAFALAAMRWHGYRSNNRYLVFQCLPLTLGLEAKLWRVLELCHRRRNLAEYEGYLDVEERLLEDLIRVTEELQKVVAKLGAVSNE